MKSTELRIGNWLQSKAGMPFKVTSDDIRIIDDGHSKSKPIPLTPELLAECGFTTIGMSKDFRRGRLIVHTRKRGFVVKKSMPIIETLHQFQNLYFALTGEELKIEL